MLLISFGCSTTPPYLEKPAGDFYWPPPPETPRIKWITQWSNTYDFGKPSAIMTTLMGAEAIDMLLRPNGVVADSAGNVYVADSSQHVVFIFDVQGKALKLMGRGMLGTPIGLAVDDKRGIIYVSDSKLNHVYGIEKSSGRVVRELGAENEFKSPSGLVFDEERDRLYLSDTQNQIVRVYDGNGKPLFTIGKKGREDGEFKFPAYLALDRDGRLYVVDTFNFRIQIFDPNGKFIKKFGRLGDASGYFSRPAGIGVDSDGHIYVVDTAFNNFQIFDDTGRLLLWVGSAGKKAGQFSLPTGMYIDKKDRIYVTDTFNYRVQVFEYLKEKKP